MIWVGAGIAILLVLIGCPILIKQFITRTKYVPLKALCVECEKKCGKTEKKFESVMTYNFAGREYTEKLAFVSYELSVDKEYECYCDPENPSTIILAGQKWEPLVMAIICLLALVAAGILLYLQMV